MCPQGRPTTSRIVGHYGTQASVAHWDLPAPARRLSDRTASTVNALYVYMTMILTRGTVANVDYVNRTVVASLFITAETGTRIMPEEKAIGTSVDRFSKRS